MRPGRNEFEHTISRHPRVGRFETLIACLQSLIWGLALVYFVNVVSVLQAV